MLTGLAYVFAAMNKSGDSSSDHSSQHVNNYNDSKDEEKRPSKEVRTSFEHLAHNEHNEINLSVVRKLTADMADRGKNIGMHLESIHGHVPTDQNNREGKQDQCLSEELADELRKRTTSVDGEIKQLENQMGQLQRTLVKGKARRESIKHRISVSSSPGGSRKVSAITPYLPTSETEDLSKEDLKARLEVLENEKQELIEDKKDLNEEIKFLKYQLQYRLEVQTLQNDRESSMKTESRAKLENENKALREETRDLKERLSMIRTKLKESGDVGETLLSVADVSDSEDGTEESLLESELDRLHTERKILLSTIMRMQNLDREDYRRDSVSFTDYGVQCDLSEMEQADGRESSPLKAKLNEENETLRKHMFEMETENEELEEENRALDEENGKLTEEKRTLEDTINKLRTQINDTLDTTLDEIEHLHSFNEELERKLQQTDAREKELSETLNKFRDRNCKALENLLDEVENKSSLKEVVDSLRHEIQQINEENSVFVYNDNELDIPRESTEERVFSSNLLKEVKTCKELLESQRSHIRELQMDKRDIEENYTKMKRELLIIRSNKQQDRKKLGALDFLRKRRAKSMNDGTLGDPEMMDKSIFQENESLKLEIKRLNSVKLELDDVIRDIKRDKTTLEDEKVCLLGSLFHQLERNEQLEVQIEELTAAVEQWEAKAELYESTGDVFEEQQSTSSKRLDSQLLSESDEKERQASDASPTEVASDSDRHENKEMVQTTATVASEVDDREPITNQHSAPVDNDVTEESRGTNTLLNAVGSSTGESLQEMKQKIHVLGENLRNVQEAVFDLETERDKLQEDLGESKNNEKELRVVVLQLKRETNINKDKLLKANQLVETLQECLQEVHDEKLELLESVEEANEEKIVSKKHSELLNNRLNEVTQQRDLLKSESGPLKAENKELRENYEKAVEIVKEIHKVLDDIGKLGATPVDGNNTENENITSKNNDESEKATVELGKEIIAWLGTVFVDVDRRKKELKRTNIEHDQLKTRLDTVLTERQTLQKYVREMDDKKRQMKMFITKLTEEKEKLTDQIDDVRQQKVNLADALENVYQSKEKLQNRLDEALCKQDQYRNSLLEAVDEARTLKESLYRMVNEHETMKESLLTANREIGRLKSQEGMRRIIKRGADQVDYEANELERDLEKGQRESEEGKEFLTELKAERDDLQDKVRNLLEAEESLKADLEKLGKEKEEQVRTESDTKCSVDMLSRENKMLKSQIEEFVYGHGISEEEIHRTLAGITQTESSTELNDGVPTAKPTENETDKETDKKDLMQSKLLSVLWHNLSMQGTEIAKLQRQVNKLEKEKENLLADLQGNWKEKEELAEHHQDLSSENTLLKGTLAELTSIKEANELQQSSEDVHESSEDVEHLREWYEVITAEKQQLEKELESASNDNEELIEDIKRLTEDKEKLRQQLEQAESAKSNQKPNEAKEDGLVTTSPPSEENRDSKNFQEEIKKAFDDVESTGEGNEALEASENELKELQSNFEKRLEEMGKEKEKLVQDKVALVNSLHVEKDKLNQSIEKLQDERNALHEKYNELSERSKTFKTTEMELEKSIKETEALEKQVEILSKESAAMKEEAEERIRKLIELEEKVIVTMEKKLELAEYAADLKYKKESLKKKCAELSCEVEGLKKSRDQLLAGKLESDERLMKEVKELSNYKGEIDTEVAELKNIIRIGKQDFEVLKIKLGSMDRKNKELKEELNRAKKRETAVLTELEETTGDTSSLSESLDRDLNDAQKKKAEKNDALLKLEEENARLKKDMKIASEELERIRKENEQLRKNLSDLSKVMETILKEKDTNSTPDTKLQRLKDKFTELEEQVNKVTEEAEKISQEKSHLTGFLDEVNKEMGDILEENGIKKSEPSTNEQKVKGCIDDVNGIRQSVEGKTLAEKSLAKLRSKTDMMKKQLGDSYEREASIRGQLDKTKDENERLSREIKTKSKFLRTMRDSFEKLLQEKNIFAKKAAEKAMKLDDVRQTCSELRQYVSALKREIQETQEVKNEMSSKCDVIQKERDDLVLKLQSIAAENSKFEETCQSLQVQVNNGLGEQERTNEGMEKPLEKVDGDTVSCKSTDGGTPIENEIVVKKAEGLEKVIDTTKEEPVNTVILDHEKKENSLPEQHKGADNQLTKNKEHKVDLEVCIAGLEVEGNGLKEALRKMEERCHVSDNRVEELEVELSDAKDKNHELQKELELLQEKLQTVHQEMEEEEIKLKKQVQEKISEIETLRIEIAEEKKSLSKLNGKIKALEKESDDMQSQCNETKKAADTAKKENVRLENIVKETSSSLQNLQDKLVVSKNFMQKILDENTDLKECIVDMHKRKIEMKEKIGDLQEKVESVGTQLEQTRDDKSKLEIKNAKSEEVVSTLKEQLALRRDLLQTLEKDRESFKDNLRDAKKEIEMLKETCIEMTTELEKIKLDQTATNNALEEAKHKEETLTREIRREKVRRDREMGNIKKENAKLLRDEERAEREAASLRQQLDDERIMNGKLEELVEASKAENDMLRQSLQNISDEKEKTTKVLEGNRKEGKRLLTLTKDLKSKVANLEALLQVAKSEKKVFEEEVRKTKVVNADLRMRITEANEDKEELEEILTEMREKRRKLHDDIDKALNERDVFEDELIATKKDMRQHLECTDKEKKQMKENLEASEKEASYLHENINELERKNAQLIKTNQDTKEELEERKEETEKIRNELRTTEIKIKALEATDSENKLEETLVQLQNAQGEANIMAMEARVKRAEDIENEPRNRQAVCEDIVAVREQGLQSIATDEMDSASKSGVCSLEDQISNYRIEKMRMQARLEETACKLMALQEELYQVSKERVHEDGKAMENHREREGLRDALRSSKYKEAKLKQGLQNSNEIQIELRKHFKDVLKEKEKLEKKNELLRHQKGLVEKVIVTSSEMPVVSQIPNLEGESLVKAASIDSARKEIVILESHVKDLRSHFRKARDEIFDLTHELSDKEQELKQKDRLHQEERKRQQADIAEIEKENQTLRSDLSNALEFERSRSSFSTLKDLKGSHRKAESDMLEVIDKTTDLLKRGKTDDLSKHKNGSQSLDSFIKSSAEEKRKVVKELDDTIREKNRLARELKRSEDTKTMIKQILAEMVIELDKVRKLVGFYSGELDKNEEETVEKPQSKKELVMQEVETRKDLSSSECEGLQSSLDDLRAKIRELEQGLQAQKNKGENNILTILKDENNELQNQLSTATKENVGACEKLRYLQDELSRILVERKMMQDIGEDTRKELQKLVDCLSTEREEKENMSNEYSKLLVNLHESERSEKALKGKLNNLKQEIEEMHWKKQDLEKAELCNVKVQLDVDEKQKNSVATEIEADYERGKRENDDLEIKNKQLEVQCLENAKAYETLLRDYKTFKLEHEALGKKIKEMDEDKRALVEETYSFKQKLEKRNQELSARIEREEHEVISLKAKYEGLSGQAKRLEAHVRDLEQDKKSLTSRVLSTESKKQQVEQLNREQLHEIQELILQSNRKNIVGQKLEKLFYENTRLEEQKRMLATRVESLEGDVNAHMSARRDLENDMDGLLVRLDKVQEEKKKGLYKAEYLRKLLDKQEEESQLQIDALSFLIEKIRREKEDIDKKGSHVDQLREDYTRLEEENTYLSDLVSKVQSESLALKKENILIRRACQQLREKKSAGGSFAERSLPSSRGSSASSLTVPHPFAHGAAELRSSSFERSSPEGSELTDGSTDRMDSRRHPSPLRHAQRSQPRKRSSRQSDEITPGEMDSLQGSEAESTSVCSRESYCSPILSVVDLCPVHRQPSSERSPSHSPKCKKEKNSIGIREFMTLEKYV